MIQIIEIEGFPLEKDNKKWHYSFSSTKNYDANIEFINTFKVQRYPWLLLSSVAYLNLNDQIADHSAFANAIKFSFGDQRILND